MSFGEEDLKNASWPNNSLGVNTAEKESHKTIKEYSKESVESSSIDGDKAFTQKNTNINIEYKCLIEANKTKYVLFMNFYLNHRTTDIKNIKLLSIFHI